MFDYITETSQSETIYDLLNSAFYKALASVIMSQFPIVSIFAIFIARKANSLLAQAEKQARCSGLSLGGKRIPTKIMGLVGLIAGIVNSIYYVIIGLFLIFYIFLCILMIIADF